MKLIILSDVHGRQSYAERILEKEKAQNVIFLGDGYRDMQALADFFKEVRFWSVHGNCDGFGGESEQCITLGGKRIFFTHGHRYNVKMERETAYITLRSEAVRQGAQIVLFGHTHVPDIVYRGGMILLNPGAVANGRYGVIEMGEETVKPELKQL